MERNKDKWLEYTFCSIFWQKISICQLKGWLVTVSRLKVRNSINIEVPSCTRMYTTQVMILQDNIIMYFERKIKEVYATKHIFNA